MAHGQVLLDGLGLQLPDADDLVFSGNLEGKIIKSPFPESIQVGIPRFASANVEASLSSIF